MAQPQYTPATGEGTKAQGYIYKKGQWVPESTDSGDMGGYINNMVGDIMANVKAQKDMVAQYSKNNPFAFDEALAKKSATAEYKPYYTELLNDYLDNMALKRKTVEDDKKLLTEMNAYEVGKASREYQQAVGAAEQGFADSGMFYSGIKKKAMGQGEVGYNANTQAREDQFGNNMSGLENTLAGYDLNQKQTQRDIQRQQETAIEQGILQRKQEAIKSYSTPVMQSFSRIANPGSMAGYTVPSGFGF